MLALGLLAAPPRCNGRQCKILAAQPAAEAWQEGQKRPRLKDARAKRIDDGDRALPHRLRQARRADARGRIELQRIGKGGIESPPQNADRLQPGDGANHQPAIGNSQVLAFEQHDAEIAGDVGVLVVGLVERPGRHDRDASFRIGGGIDQRVAEAAEEASKAMDMHLAVNVGQRARRGDAVLQREAGARWRRPARVPMRCRRTRGGSLRRDCPTTCSISSSHGCRLNMK